MSVRLKQLSQDGAVEGKPVVWDNALGEFVAGDALIPTTEVSAVGDTTTTSATDVLIDSMTVTPVAGCYVVWLAGSIEHSATNEDIVGSIYVGGVQHAPSESLWRRGGSQANVATSFECQGKVAVNGAQAIEGKWRTTSATATMHQRSLIVLKVES